MTQTKAGSLRAQRAELLLFSTAGRTKYTLRPLIPYFGDSFGFKRSQTHPSIVERCIPEASPSALVSLKNVTVRFVQTAASRPA